MSEKEMNEILIEELEDLLLGTEQRLKKERERLRKAEIEYEKAREIYDDMILSLERKLEYYKRD